MCSAVIELDLDSLQEAKVNQVRATFANTCLIFLQNTQEIQLVVVTLMSQLVLAIWVTARMLMMMIMLMLMMMQEEGCCCK